jgi:hypothetical protein
LTRVNIPGGAPFYRLDTKPRRGILPWNEIERCAGRLRTKLLLPADVSLPESHILPADSRHPDPGMREFKARRLPLMLAVRLAAEILRNCAVPPQDLRITFVDPDGNCTKGLEPLVMLAGSLRVYTHEPAAYRQTAASLLNRYGVTLLVSDSPQSFANADLVICDNLSLLTGRERGLICTSDNTRSLPDCRVARIGQVFLPPPLDSLIPPDFDPVRFAAALYELCGVKEMDRLSSAPTLGGEKPQPIEVKALGELLQSVCDHGLRLVKSGR